MIKKILVPTDDLKFSEKGSRYAIDMAKRYGASITLIHVIHSKNGSARRRLKELDKGVIKDAEEFLERVAAKSRDEGIKTKTKILLTKSTPDAIMKEAKSDNYDLIVMCTKDMNGTKRLFKGSVSEEVIKNAPCPVFLYR